MPSRSPNLLAGPYLERAAHMRKNAAHVQAALTNPETLFVPVWESRSSILRHGDIMIAHFVTGVQAFASTDPGEFVLLGEFRGHAVFAVGLSGERPQLPDSAVDFQDLRTLAGALPPEEAGLLAYARAMIHWRETDRKSTRLNSSH